MVPAATVAAWGMEAFRDRFLDAFGGDPVAGAVAAR
jgi:hypothetical protein